MRLIWNYILKDIAVNVGFCLIFPMSTYALDLELYFKRYRCLNPGMSLPKGQKNRLQGSSCGLFWAN
jgi:hypothetical protein